MSKFKLITILAVCGLMSAACSKRKVPAEKCKDLNALEMAQKLNAEKDNKRIVLRDAEIKSFKIDEQKKAIQAVTLETLDALKKIDSEIELPENLTQEDLNAIKAEQIAKLEADALNVTNTLKELLLANLDADALIQEVNAKDNADAFKLEAFFYSADGNKIIINGLDGRDSAKITSKSCNQITTESKGPKDPALQNILGKDAVVTTKSSLIRNKSGIVEADSLMIEQTVKSSKGSMSLQKIVRWGKNLPSNETVAVSLISKLLRKDANTKMVPDGDLAEWIKAANEKALTDNARYTKLRTQGVEAPAVEAMIDISLTLLDLIARGDYTDKDAKVKEGKNKGKYNFKPEVGLDDQGPDCDLDTTHPDCQAPAEPEEEEEEAGDSDETGDTDETGDADENGDADDNSDADENGEAEEDAEEEADDSEEAAEGGPADPECTNPETNLPEECASEDAGDSEEEAADSEEEAADSEGEAADSEEEAADSEEEAADSEEEAADSEEEAADSEEEAADSEEQAGDEAGVNCDDPANAELCQPPADQGEQVEENTERSFNLFNPSTW